MKYDQLERRCPRLGGPVRFHYCHTGEHAQQPCFKVLDCWWEYFDVATFFRQRLSKESMDRLVAPPAPNKVASLMEIIQQAQQRTQSKKE